ncbi:MAG: pyridoxamine 5'-phosphate oxidase family protein [Bacteroidales bacterium]|nr:pyridoxamine 5'-phosphate oxidase family protein [Bacteroidales bacterium]
MNVPDKSIVKFINKHHTLHLATSDNNEPYCATCFYLYDEENNTFYFASNEETRHIQEIRKQMKVAFSIASETRLITSIRGIQCMGIVKEIFNKELKNKYIAKFPVALFIPFKLWGIEPYFIKMTDNRLGFGRKLIWEKKNDFK